MGHNSVVSGHPKSTRIPQVDELSTRTLDFGRHNVYHYKSGTSIKYQNPSLKVIPLLNSGSYSTIK